MITALEEAALLVAQGYCRTSNKYKTVTRLDRPDWLYVMAKIHAPWDTEGAGMAWAKQAGEDFYRRCHSSDTVTVNDDAWKLMPPSGGTTMGYREKIL